MFLGIKSGQLAFVKNFKWSDPLLYQGLLVPQAWSLGIELTFYLLAPLLLTRKFLIWSALTISLTLRAITIGYGFGLEDPWSYRFFPTELALFLLGALSQQYLLKRIQQIERQKLTRMATGATVLMILLCSVYFLLPVNELIRRPILLVSFVLLSPLMFEFQHFFKWDNFIGSLSYPIYIDHMLVLWFMLRESNRMNAGIVMVSVLTIIGSIALAFLLDRWIARPVEALRHRLRRNGVDSFEAVAPKLPVARVQ